MSSSTPHAADELQAIIHSLFEIGFFAGTPADDVELIETDCIRQQTVLDRRIARLFRFDLEDNAECCGKEMIAGANRALARVFGPACRVEPDEGPYSSGCGWQEYATLIGQMINAELDGLGIADRVYLTRFDEFCWSALITEPMASLILRSGKIDPEAATLYLPVCEAR